MNRYYVVFENIEKFYFLVPVQKEHILLVSKDKERHFTIYDTDNRIFLGVFADNEEEAIRGFIDWYEINPLIYDESKNDYIPFLNLSSHYIIYPESIICDHIIAGK